MVGRQDYGVFPDLRLIWKGQLTVGSIISARVINSAIKNSRVFTWSPSTLQSLKFLCDVCEYCQSFNFVIHSLLILNK